MQLWMEINVVTLHSSKMLMFFLFLAAEIPGQTYPPKPRYTTMWFSLPTNNLSTSQHHKISVPLMYVFLIGSQEKELEFKVFH